jgi:membrane-associated phospholipid phosphatase
MLGARRLRAAVAADLAALPTRALALFAAGDLVMLGHLAIVWTLVVLAMPAAGAADAARRIEVCAAVLVLGCAIGRGTRWPALLRSLIHRVVAVGVVLASYLMLRWTLPVVQPGNLDAQLDRIDVALCGVRPTVWLEPWMTPTVVEVLAFFYFSYFVLCALHAAIAMRTGASAETSSEFAIGTSVVYGVGQLGYVLVPGVGPHAHLHDVYQGPLEGGFFWRCVLATVEAGSAMKDIFPSLHTAAPVWFALFAARRASRTGSRGWRWLAGVTAVFAANIVVSTVALRWHYVIDLVAGMALAALAAWLAPRVSSLEARWRRRAGLPSPWDLS